MENIRWFSIFLIFGVVGVFFVSAGNVITVETNVISFDTYLEVEVSENTDLGDVSKGEQSKEVTVYVNNTGTSDVMIVPRLPDNYNGKIYNYLYMREQQSDVNGVKNVSVRIGNFSMNVSSPSSGNNVTKEHFYIKLDLRDYPYPIYQDLMNYKVNITIRAIPL